MNMRTSLLTAALLLTGASSALAASVELKVAGKLTPASCVPFLSDGGVVDFGKRSVKDLNQNSITHLGTKSLQVRVGCDGPTTFAVNLIDNRSSSAYAPEFYGLGHTDAGEKLGGYSVAYADAVTEAGPSNVLRSLDMGKTWLRSEGIPVDPGSLAAVGDKSATYWSPILITTLLMDMLIDAYIAPANGITLTKDESLDGSSILEIHHL